MPNYLRAAIAGGTFFFTVALLERRRRLLTEHIGELRDSFRTAQQTRPFRIDAIVILPDYLHRIWTLPEDDADNSTQWRLIESAFARTIPKTERRSMRRVYKNERESGKGDFGNTPSVTKRIFSMRMWLTAITIQSSMVLRGVSANGPI